MLRIVYPICCRIDVHKKFVVVTIATTNKRDSIWIADLHKHGLVKGSFIPHKPIRELRDLIRYKSKLTNVSSSEKNRHGHKQLLLML